MTQAWVLDKEVHVHSLAHALEGFLPTSSSCTESMSYPPPSNLEAKTGGVSGYPDSLLMFMT